MDDRLCAAGEHCRDHHNGQPAPAGDGPLCEACLQAAESACTALVGDYVGLTQHLPPSVGVWGDGQPRGTGELRVPMRLGVEALQREIWWVLTAWEQVVREHDRLSDSITRGVRAGWAVQAAAGILRPRIRLLATIPATEFAGYPRLDDSETYRWRSIEYAHVPGWRGVLDITALHRRAVGMQGLTAATPEHCHGVPCCGCDAKDLYREPAGGDGVFCGSCGLRYTPAAYTDWVKLVAGHVKHRTVAA